MGVKSSFLFRWQIDTEAILTGIFVGCNRKHDIEYNNPKHLTVVKTNNPAVSWWELVYLKVGYSFPRWQLSPETWATYKNIRFFKKNNLTRTRHLSLIKSESIGLITTFKHQNDYTSVYKIGRCTYITVAPPTYLTIFSCFLYMVKKRFSHIEEHEMVTKINTDAMAKKKTLQ